MTTQTLFRMVLAAGLFCAMPVVMAKPSKAAKTEQKSSSKKAKVDKNAVGNAIKEITFLTDKKPNPKAKFFVYLQSSRNCSRCKQEMPGVVKEYKDMPKNKVELIFVCRDNSEEDAIEFMKEYKADFPCLMISSPEVQKLPGFTQSESFPWASIVDSSGKELKNSHTKLIMMKWKQITEEAKGK